MAINYWADVEESEITGTFEQSNVFPAIPDGTKVIADIETIAWDSFPGSDHKHINMKWEVTGEEYTGRKLFQSIYLNGTDPNGQYYDAKKDPDTISKARAMFLAIDKNAGGHIFASGQKPTDKNMGEHLTKAKMILLLGVNKKGKNFVRDVYPAPADTPKPTPKPKQDNVYYDRGSDIPFN
jgi:hypothetical protein